MPDPQSLTAGEITQQASSLAEHLQRAGVQFLPQPSPDSVEQLRARFAGDDTAVSQTGAATDSREPDRKTVLPDSDGSPPSLPPIERTQPAVARPMVNPPRRLSPVAGSPLVEVETLREPYQGQSLPLAERQAELQSMAGQVAACTRCEALVTCRTQTVFGEGPANPRIVFFGEAPGSDEDRTGRPFVGKAGQLLTKMIEACTFRREDCYILNTVKCRPPGNRNPEPGEIANCREYFERQLSILRPEYIVCLGAISSQTLLKSKLPVGRLRGRLHRYFDSKVLVTYHPAYLLRTPAAKKAAWEDLQLLLRDAGVDPKANK